MTVGRDESRNRVFRWLPFAALILLALLAFSGNPPREFVYDDQFGIRENPAITGQLPVSSVFLRDFWGRDAAHTVGTYRPITVAFFRAFWAVGLGTPGGFRAASLLMHIAFVCLAFAVLKTIVPAKTAFLATALASVCAATSEAVLCDVASADMLCAIGATTGLWAFGSNGRLAGIMTAGAFLFSAGSKETGLLAPAVWVLFEWLVPPTVSLRARATRLAGCAVVAIPYAVGRHAALGTFFIPAITDTLRNPLIGLSPLARALGAGKVFVTRYALGIILPQRRTYDCSTNACGPAEWSDPLAWAGIALWILICAAPFLLRRRAPIAAGGLGWFAIFFLPGSNFLVAGPTIYGERLLYLPALGLFLAVAQGVTALARPRWAYAAVAVFMTGNMLSDRVRVLDWQSTEDLALSALEYSPGSALNMSELAVASRRKHDYAAVEKYSREAIAIYPDWMNPHRELAAALFATGRMDEAQKEYDAAFHSRFAHGEDQSLVFNYATYLETLGRTREAESIVAGWLRDSPDQPEMAALDGRLRREIASKPER